MPENPATDETRLFLCLALDCLEEAAAIICGRTYGYGVAGSDLERAGQAMKELLETLNDARWVLTDPERWQELQTELRTQAAEADQAFRAIPRSCSL